MAVYAIGDVQGCLEPLRQLLAQIRFDVDRDRLWFTGDLVNRGPSSAAVMRWVRDLDDRAVTVLGNHDLHLLAVAAGQARRRPRDRLDDVLMAADREPLLAWLRARPLLHHDPETGFTLVHAGLLPQWDLATAEALAREAETLLRGPKARAMFANMYGDRPDVWHDALAGWDRVRIVINSFTRLRYCDPEGRMDLGPKGPPGTQPTSLLPWFQVPARCSRELRVVFGHWSALGLWNADGVIGLDTGCVWGHALSAVRLAPGPIEFFSVPCPPPPQRVHGN